VLHQKRDRHHDERSQTKRGGLLKQRNRIAVQRGRWKQGRSSVVLSPPTPANFIRCSKNGPPPRIVTVLVVGPPKRNGRPTQKGPALFLEIRKVMLFEGGMVRRDDAEDSFWAKGPVRGNGWLDDAQSNYPFSQ